MKPSETRPSQPTKPIPSDSSETSIVSFMKALATRISGTAPRPRPGDPTDLSQVFSTIKCASQRYADAMNAVSSSEQSIERPSRNSSSTSLPVLLYPIYSYFATMGKRLESLKRRLTRINVSERPITLEELRQVDFQVVSMILELAEISRILRSGYEESSSQTQE